MMWRMLRRAEAEPTVWEVVTRPFGVLLALLLVLAANIGQAYQFVATGSAPLGFVALSQVMSGDKPMQGSAWVVPASMHPPLQQDAVVLKHGAGNPAAVQFAQYLKGDKARRRS